MILPSIYDRSPVQWFTGDKEIAIRLHLRAGQSPVQICQHGSRLPEGSQKADVLSHSSGEVLKETLSAYRKGHNTSTVPLATRDDILPAMQQGEVTMAVLADYSKAFGRLGNCAAKATWSTLFQGLRPPPPPPPPPPHHHHHHHHHQPHSRLYDTKEEYWGQKFCQMERDMSVPPTEMTRPVKVDHLQSWSRIFRSDQTVPFDVPTEISGILC